MEHKEFERVSQAILALFPPLTETEQRVSLALYRLLAEGNAVSIDTLARSARVASAQAKGILSAQPDVHRDGGGRIIGYGGLTVAKTKHRIQIGRKILYTWCAWDTLFIPQLLDVTAQVESTCPATGERVSLTIHPDRIGPAGECPPVSFVAPDRDKASADIVRHFCCHVQYFATERAGSEWVSKHPEMRLATLGQAWELGCRHIALRYPVAQQSGTTSPGQCPNS